MTRLLALFAGNPLIFVGAVLAVFLFGATTGGTAAWKFQGVRITAAKQELVAYQQEQVRIFQEAQHAADIERKQASEQYAQASQDLARAVSDGDVYRRCVAAGKCGVRVLKQSTCAAGISLPAAERADEASTDTVFTGPEAAAEDPVVNDCAVTTLMLNSLQADIESQPGYAP